MPFAFNFIRWQHISAQDGPSPEECAVCVLAHCTAYPMEAIFFQSGAHLGNVGKWPSAVNTGPALGRCC
jgi:hypothetical protein